MAKLRNTAEGGTNGAAVTAGNSGGPSGDPFTAAAATLTYTTARSAHGTVGFAAPSTPDAIARWAISGTTIAARLYIWATTPTTNDQGIVRVSHVTDTTAMTIYLNSAGALRVSDKSSTNIWTGPAAMPTGQWVRVELLAAQGATTTSGTVRVAYYLGDSTTPIADSGVLTGRNLGGNLGAFTQIRLGKTGTTAGPLFYFDDLAVDTGTDATALIGPPATEVASPARMWLGGTYTPVDMLRYSGNGYQSVIN